MIEKHLRVARAIGVHAANAIQEETNGLNDAAWHARVLRDHVQSAVEALVSKAAYAAIIEASDQYRNAVLNAHGYAYIEHTGVWHYTAPEDRSTQPTT